jgi:RNA polymerase sigma factor (sigma-70 family)
MKRTSHACSKDHLRQRSFLCPTKLPSYQEFPDNLDGWNVINFESNVFQTHFPKLVSYLSRMCPNQCHRVLDPEQIALTSIYQFLEQCRSETSYQLLDSIRVWRMLRRIAKRRLIDANNRMSRSRRPDRKTDYQANIENYGQPFSAVSQDEQLEELSSLLSKGEASTLRMLYAGYSLIEVATVMGVTVRTVSRWRKRIQGVWVSLRIDSCSYSQK